MTAVYDRVRTVVPIESDLSDEVIPAGAVGSVVECYMEPVEGYAVDLEIPDSSVVGGKRYVNVLLYPGQFEVVR
jgi:hypothetical protein